MALPRTPTIETSNVSDTRRKLSETLDRVRRHEARVVVEKSGIPVGAIVSMEDLERLKRIDNDRALLLEVLADAQQGFIGIPPEEIEAEIEKAIAEVEAEAREARNNRAHLASRS